MLQLPLLTFLPRHLESQLALLTKHNNSTSRSMDTSIVDEHSVYDNRLSEIRRNEANNAKLRDIQTKLDRLSENNRLLILELEEKRSLSQEMQRKYQTMYKENI